MTSCRRTQPTRARDGRAAADRARPVAPGHPPPVPPDRADAQGRRRSPPSSTSSCCRSSPASAARPTEITKVEPAFLVGGLALQIAAWFSLLAAHPLGARRGRHQISRIRMFRIQMSTKALGNIVPGGSAAGSALGYRLMTLSGVQRPGRRLRPGHRRARLGRRAQPDLLDRPARVDPAARRQPAVRDGRARRARDHARRRPARLRPAARPGSRRAVPALDRRASCASTRTPPATRCARSASGSRT